MPFGVANRAKSHQVRPCVVRWIPIQVRVFAVSPWPHNSRISSREISLALDAEARQCWLPVESSTSPCTFCRLKIFCILECGQVLHSWRCISFCSVSLLAKFAVLHPGLSRSSRISSLSRFLQGTTICLMGSSPTRRGQFCIPELSNRIQFSARRYRCPFSRNGELSRRCPGICCLSSRSRLLASGQCPPALTASISVPPSGYPAGDNQGALRAKHAGWRRPHFVPRRSGSDHPIAVLR